MLPVVEVVTPLKKISTICALYFIRLCVFQVFLRLSISIALAFIFKHKAISFYVRVHMYNCMYVSMPSMSTGSVRIRPWVDTLIITSYIWRLYLVGDITKSRMCDAHTYIVDPLLIQSVISATCSVQWTSSCQCPARAITFWRSTFFLSFSKGLLLINWHS